MDKGKNISKDKTILKFERLLNVLILFLESTWEVVSDNGKC